MLDFARDKKLWERVRVSEEFAQHRREIEALYHEAFKTEPRSHSVEDILGANDHSLWRLQFDHLQSAALMALIYPDVEEYYQNLLRAVWAYLNEYSWAPLGHFTMQYYGKTPKDFDCGLIDIFAASVGFALAEVKNLFRDRFPSLIADRITYELRRHIIEPYRTRKFFWESHDNNWTAVCTGAVGSVLMYEDPDLFYECQERLHASMESYLSSYNDDGMCVEGVGYWGFGFGFFASYAMLERELTEGRVDWFLRPKVKEIAKFLQKTFLQRDVMVTYSDCSGNPQYSFGLPHMLRSVYGEELERLPVSSGIVMLDNTHFHFALRSVIYYSADNVSDEIADRVTYHTEGSTYFFKRTPYYGFSTKGGNNGESHNHVDVASFILARNNKQILCDLGAGPYEDGYHTERRYTFFNPSAYAHSIPLLDGVGEDDIRRENVTVEYDKAADRVRMDFTNAYGVDFLTLAERNFAFTDRDVTLLDRFVLTKETEITERFVTVIKPVILDGAIRIDDVTLVAEGELMPTVTVTEAKTHLENTPYPVYLIDYKLPEGATEFRIAFRTPEK